MKIASSSSAVCWGQGSSIPVSLANITGGPWCASAKCRVRGYFVLLNKCSTMQMSPASTAMPVVTPSRVGRSEPMSDKSERVKAVQ